MRDILKLLFGGMHISYLKPAYTISFYLMIYIVIKFVVNFFIFKNIIKKIDNEFKQDIYNTEWKGTKNILNFVKEGIVKTKKILKEKIENPLFHIKEELHLINQKIHLIYIKHRNFYLGVIFISFFLLLITFLFEIIENSYLYLNKEEMLSSSIPFIKTILEKVYYELCPIYIFIAINCFLSTILILNTRKKFCIIQIKIKELFNQIIIEKELSKKSKIEDSAEIKKQPK